MGLVWSFVWFVVWAAGMALLAGVIDELTKLVLRWRMRRITARAHRERS